MSEHKSEYRYENAPCDDDELYMPDLKNGGSDSRSTMFEENGRQTTGSMFEEDGDAGSSPSVFQSARPVVSGARVNAETRVIASVKPTGKPPLLSDQSRPTDSPRTTDHPSFDPSRSTGRRLPATSTMPPTYPNASLAPASVLTSFKKWSLNTIKYTKQYVAERLGQTVRTVDPETEARVEALRETQRQYLHILRLARALHLHFQRLVQTQRVLGDAFGELAAKNAELAEQFAYNSETQKLLARNGEVLLVALNVFMTSISTLCNTTIEDTLMTVKNHEAARIKYDADRLYLDGVRLQARDAASIVKAQDAERIYMTSKQRFDRLHNDLTIKLRFLDENKVSVCQKHLYLLHKGFISYVAGNRDGVEDVLKRVHETAIKSDTTSSSEPNPSMTTTVTPSDACRTTAADSCHASSREAYDPSSD